MTTPKSYVVVKNEPTNTVVVSDSEPNTVLVSIVGAAGERGNSISSGFGDPPSSLGFEGDIYIDSLSGNFWGPKTSSGWPDSPFYSAGLTKRNIHVQEVPVETWNITHDLLGYPAVTIVDSASTVVIGEVSYISTSQIRVDFTAPFSGYAYLT
jgi:hypothetical protein